MEFVSVPVVFESLEKLSLIVIKRLPTSAYFCNILKIAPRFADRFKIYTLFGDEPDKTWIIARFYREDIGVNYCISAPPDCEINGEIRQLFIESEIFDWFKPYLFGAIERPVSQLIYDISVYHFGNGINSRPCKSYLMDLQKAQSLDLSLPSNIDNKSVILKPLEPESGSEFILKSWKYATSDSKGYIKCLIEKNTTSGVYINGDLVSGIIFNNNGLWGMLYTDPQWRNKGLASLCFKNGAKISAQNDLYPCSNVEIRNEKSNQFHEKLGFEFTHYCDYIRCDNPTY